MADTTPTELISVGTYPSKILGFDPIYGPTPHGNHYLPVNVLVFGHRRRVYMPILDYVMAKMIQASESFWIDRPVQVKVKQYTKDDRVYCSFSFYKFEGVEADGEHKQANAEDIEPHS